MKKRNGFTLIELLAIIVILAIIAVITVPIILNIIDNAKKGSVQDSAYGYKDAINKYYLTKLADDKDYTMDNKTYTTPELKNLGVALNGQEPGTNSWVTIENNNVKTGCLQFDEYKVDITDGKVETATKGECEEYRVQVKPIVYSAKGDETPKTVSNPLTDLANKDYVTIGEEGFYIISVDNNKVELLADTCLVDDNGTYRQKISTEDNSKFITIKFGDGYWCTSSCQVLKDEYAYDVNGNAANFSGNPYPYVYYTKGNDSNNISNIVNSYVNTLALSATGRLLSYEEAENLDSDIRNIPNIAYWLGSTKYDSPYTNFGIIFKVGSTGKSDYIGTTMSNGPDSSGYKHSIRPVIEVPLSSF